MNKLLTLVITAFLSFVIQASGDSAELDRAHVDISDKHSLQNGAKLFMNFCSGCHSLKYMRYNRMAKDLDLTDEQVMKNLMFVSDKQIGDTITVNMDPNDAMKWFGALPPDLSLTARSRGVDWIYTYLNSFYADSSKTLGVNNTILTNTSMPDVLWSLRESKSEVDFKQDIHDIVNFLDYVGEPIKLVRISLGWKVLGFLFILLILSYFLKKEYWRDVKYGKWKAR